MPLPRLNIRAKILLMAPFVLVPLIGLFQNAGTVQIRGQIQGSGRYPTGFYIWGWACRVGSDDKLEVKLKTADGVELGTVLADQQSSNKSADDNITLSCANTTSSHRFRFNLTYEQVALHQGKAVLAYVLSDSGDAVIGELLSQEVKVPLPDVFAKTTTGWVEGIADAYVSGVTSFKGIPYAAPPTNNSRWRAPQTASPWSGDRKATEFSNACIQDNTLGSIGADQKSEDCLTVNVWRADRQANMPVVVYIHGGGFARGSSQLPTYDGSFIASQGIVFVSFNYRVGIFGFFSHPFLRQTLGRETGNFGLMDQHLAFQWVKNNIAEFGGNPDNVTIMGSSAGGASVGYWMTSPQGDGLFNRAIMESGGGSQTSGLATVAGGTLVETVGTCTSAPLSAEERTDEFLEELFYRREESAALKVAKCGSQGQFKGFYTDQTSKDEPFDYSALPRCLRDLTSVSQLSTLSNACLTSIFLKTPASVLASTCLAKAGFHPFKDEKYVLGGTLDLFRSNQEKHLPFIVGSNGWEASVALSEISAAVAANKTTYYYGISKADLVATYLSPERSVESVSDLNLSQLVYGDRTFGAPARLLAQYHANNGAPTYRYFFNYVGQGLSPKPQGAAHHIMNAFSLMTLVTRPELDVYNPTSVDESVAKNWNGYWLTFMKGQGSNSGISSDGNTTLPIWQPYSATSDNVLFINNDSATQPILRNYEQLLKNRYDLIEQAVIAPCAANGTTFAK